MNWVKRFQGRLAGLTNAIARYPLTTLFLVAAAIVNAYGISRDENVTVWLLTFVVGAFLGAVSQAVYERYFSKTSARLAFLAAVLVLTAGYYLVIKQAPELSMELVIRTSVALFALLIAFIWIPAIKSKITFNQSFMITFKSLFNSLFFSGVIFAGIAIILGTFSILISEVDFEAYWHTANIVFVLFAPMYYLSLIPVFPGKAAGTASDERYEQVNKAAQCPKFLEILISYILIPLIAAYTFILVIYILKNITGEFWTDNLLEPMLVSYAITVIIVYILASDIENQFAIWFRKIFPKVLIPIVLFQIAASALNIADMGVTHTRYFVILFGIFAAISGVLLSFLPVRKNGIVAALLILFSLVAIIPPVDAFTVSRASQVGLIEDVLERNNMLQDGQIQANPSISKDDKQTIIHALQYLDFMGYTEKIAWLPEDFRLYQDFERVFGFSLDPHDSGDYKEPIHLWLNAAEPLHIGGYDYLLETYVFTGDDSEESFAIRDGGKTYQLKKEPRDGEILLKLADENGKELIRLETGKIFEKYAGYSGKDMLSFEEAVFAVENDEAKLSVIVKDATVDIMDSAYDRADIYVLIKIKRL